MICRRFDFANNDEWNHYMNRLEIPAGRESALERIKAKWYKANVVAIVLTAILALQPLVPYWSMMGAGLCSRISALVNTTLVMQRYGTPSFTPFPHAFKSWMQAATTSTPFFHLVVSMIVMNNPSLAPGLLSVGIGAAYGLAEAAPARFGRAAQYQRYLAPLVALLQRHRDRVLFLAAASELLMAFIATFAVFTRGIRGAGTAFVLWNQMKGRFHSHDAALYHRTAWTMIGQRLQPLLVRVPAMQSYIQAAQNWFSRM
ncbi:hypothetical protein H632_c23p2 [Helicosporidium sp. ATCC 50920]|nr:hypothetical protein H632_c23p2 [Helicosporidium sp. ATCC 50920]|eukprot:KDD77086.1 hypothetical protein H632_c23p2 [Helicosporidium sp. ATCC 50920]